MSTHTSFFLPGCDPAAAAQTPFSVAGVSLDELAPPNWTRMEIEYEDTPVHLAEAVWVLNSSIEEVLRRWRDKYTAGGGPGA